MRMRVLGVALAITSTLGFSCHNEPNYPTPGMSNGPAGSGSGPASIAKGSPSAGAATTTAPATTARPDSSKGAAKK